MNCSDFDKELNLYLDGELEGPMATLAASHVTSCRSCDALVLDYQKGRAMLVAAVADRAASVDLEGLWSGIEARLQVSRPSVASLAASRVRRSIKRAGRTAGRRETGVPAAWIRHFQVGITAAAAAAAFVFVFQNSQSTQNAQNTSPSTRSASAQSSQRVGAIAQSRPVRIDSMEVAAGHSVSTWVRPRSRTRVIWVANNNDRSYGVTPASHAR